MQSDFNSKYDNINITEPANVTFNDVGIHLTSKHKYIILKRLNYDGLANLNDLPYGATFMIEMVQNMTVNEGLTVLKEALIEHDGDGNFPGDVYELIESLVDASNDMENSGIANDFKSSEESQENLDDTKQLTSVKLDEDESVENLAVIFDWPFQVRLEAALVKYYSPYPEVRAVTDCLDDPNMYCETPRAYFLGILWTLIGTFVNQFFYHRVPNISLPSMVVQLFLYPCGVFLATILPKWSLKIWNYDFDLNPGPWNHKEQMLATICYNISGGTYANVVIPVIKMERFYNKEWAGVGFQILLLLATNFLGLGFAGIMRRFCVYPVTAMWPKMLPTLALNAALLKPEKREIINGWKISRYWFFLVVFLALFLYFWIPNYLMQFLLIFNWMTWISPQNRTLAEVTGMVGRLGVNPITSFDWSTINTNFCLAVPFFSQVTQYAGRLIGVFCVLGVYYTNHYWSGYIPINSSILWTNRGRPYDVKVLVNEQSMFDEEKYKQVGPPFYSAANLVIYGGFYTLFPFIFVYECSLQYKSILKAFKGLLKSLRHLNTSTFDGFDDPHSRMMSRYKEVPEWWFTCVLIISLVLAIVCAEIYPTEAPVWGLFMVIAFNFVFLIPLTTVYAATGFQFALNLFMELILGYTCPGNGLALNYLKAYGTNIDTQTESYIANQKLAHYAKIPPRASFRIQMLSVLVSSFVALGVINFLMYNIEDFCTPNQPQRMTCPRLLVYYNASIIWGAIGPKRVFTGLYPILKWCFLLGSLLPIPCLLFRKYGPKKWVRNFYPTLLIGGVATNWPPFNLAYLLWDCMSVLSLCFTLRETILLGGRSIIMYLLVPFKQVLHFQQLLSFLLYNIMRSHSFGGVILFPVAQWIR